MPVSDMSNVGPILNEVFRLQPGVVVDLGIGFGKYGVLCREVLDAVHGRCTPSSWQTVIVGIEGFEQYRNPAWGAYSKVLIEDFRNTYHLIKGNDLILMIDSLEHLDNTEASIVLESLVRNNKQVIVSVPTGLCPQGAVFGNDLETHRSTWYGPQSFIKYNYHVLHQGVCCVVSIKGENCGN